MCGDHNLESEARHVLLEDCPHDALFSRCPAPRIHLPSALVCTTFFGMSEGT